MGLMESEIERALTHIPPEVGDIALSAGVSVVDRLINYIPAVQRRQADRAISRIAERLQDSESGLIERMKSDPGVFRLVSDTLYAAARADSDAKLEALSTVASRGIEDTALLDESRHIIGILANLQVIHVRVLVALEDPNVDPEEGLDVAAVLGTSRGTAESLIADLQRLALVETVGMSWRGLHHTLKGLSSLGSEALAVLRSGEWRPVGD